MNSATWDAIVIGSGIGGLTAAGLLAGVGGMRVLVLEKHSEPGGLTHVFRRDGAPWDVGLHYVGQVEPGSQARAYFDYLSGDALRWNRMSDDFERFIYPGLDLRVPSDPGRYEARLVERFPDEARAIRRYFRDVRAVVRWDMLGFARGFVPKPVEPLLRMLQRLTAGKAVQTTKQYLDGHFRSPLLRALLASQWGDYGLPPSRSAFAIHAQIVSHYLHGAWFPEGGSGRIARTFERGIEGRGGSIRVSQEVTSIIVRDGRAVGVAVIDRRGAEPRETTYLAPIVISNVGAPITFKKLLAVDGQIGAKTAELRELVDRIQGAMSAVTLYLRLKSPVSTLGLNDGNCWINASIDHDAMEEHSTGLLKGEPQHIYVSFPSAKSGEKRFHTAEIISFVDEKAFAAWHDLPKGNRGADYSALKQRISQGLLRLAETALPGLTALVEYAELSTPLTVEHYTSHPGGHFYGLAATPDRYKSYALRPRTPIEGLYLSGSDVGCLGIVGAMMGGVGAACQVLGPKGYSQIKAALKKGPEQSQNATLPAQKRRAVLLGKNQLTTSIWQVDFELDRPADEFAPGQFARVRVAAFEWRDYSIADIDGAKLTLLISTKTGGCGSQFVIGAEPGAVTEVELPLGAFSLASNSRRKVFIATGTGLAPFLPMFRQLEKQAELDGVVLYFGCRTAAEDITARIHPLPGLVVRCLSREEPPAGGFKGRVTQAIDSADFDSANTDFYVCGSAAMVAECKVVLERKGARHVFFELY